MKTKCLTLRIEGDFVDSFIYSGTLFTVTADARIETYDWASIIDIAAQLKPSLTDRQLQEFLLDCRSLSNFSNEFSDIFITNEKLGRTKISSLSLSGWPTDINLYANRCYIAGENGVEELKFDWQNKRIDPANKFKIWHRYAYKVSANDHHRLAIAAGDHGVIAATPSNGYINANKDISTVVQEESTDCEWVGNVLVSNSRSGSFVSTFPDLPEISGASVSDNYWQLIAKLKRADPETRKFVVGNQSAAYGWVAGKKLFSVLHDGSLTVQSSEPTDPQGENSNHNQLLVMRDLNDPTINGRFLAGRSGYFGTVLETSNALYSVTERSIELLAERPVSWRVFPRARNFANHLHIVESDHLCIRAYFPSEYNAGVDAYGASGADEE